MLLEALGVLQSYRDTISQGQDDGAPHDESSVAVGLLLDQIDKTTRSPHEVIEVLDVVDSLLAWNSTRTVDAPLRKRIGKLLLAATRQLQQTIAPEVRVAVKNFAHAADFIASAQALARAATQRPPAESDLRALIRLMRIVGADPSDMIALFQRVYAGTPLSRSELARESR